MAVPVRILLLAGSDREKARLEDTLREADWPVICLRVDDEARCRDALVRERWDAIVCSFDGAQPPTALPALRDRDVDAAPALVIVLADALEDAVEAAQRLGATLCLRARGLAHLGPALERALRERDRRADAAAFQDGQRSVLEHVAAGRPLAEVLEDIVLLVERQGEGMLCSILLFDAESRRVRHGAAPHLPRAFVEGIDSFEVGPHAGCCGAAAYLRELVVVDDIGTHPNWVRYRHLALPFGLRACWSSPILSAPGGDMLGTFATYYREARGPTHREQMWVAQATHVAAIAICRDRAERAAREADARYRQIVDTAHEGVWLLDSQARTIFVNQRTADLLGHRPDELIGHSILGFMEEASRRAAEGTFIQRLRTLGEQYEFQFRRRDGTSFWAIVSGSPIHDERHEVVGALGMITDISALKQTEAALRRSEAELRIVFENTACDEAELADCTVMQFQHPDDADRDRDLVATFRSGQRRFYQGERRFVRKDGSVIWGRLTASLVAGPKKTPGAVILMIDNVTERREMEEAVRANERLRALMYGAVSDVLFYIGVEPDNRFRFLSINPAFTRNTGLSEADVVGRLLDEVMPEPSLSMVVENFLRTIRERRTISWDQVTAFPAGVRYGEVSLAPIFDASGACTTLVGTVHDVTERHAAEQRLRGQAALLDQAKDAILVHDLAGVVTYWNKGAERLYGWSSAEAVGKNLRDLTYEGLAELDEAQRRLGEAGYWSGELAQVTKDRRRIVVEASWTLIPGESDGDRSVFVINSDVTQRRSLEERVRDAQRLEGLGALAGGVAHDFNNLLTVIDGNVKVALGELPPDHAACEALAEAERATSRGTKLVRQLLTFSRRDEPTRTVVHLEPLVEEVIGLVRVAVPTGTRVETRFAADVPPVLADPTQLHQVVMNLVTNALQAIRTAGGLLALRLDRVLLEAELAAHTVVLPAGTYARLAVSDTAAGMAPATLDHIFEPFFTTKPEGEGTGLGLPVVHSIVRAHGGGIVVRSTPGSGTEFDVYFPAAPRPSAAAGPPDTAV